MYDENKVCRESSPHRLMLSYEQIRITPRVHEEMTMRQSALLAAAVSSIRNDVLSQPFALLSGVDLLGNASTAFGHMSKGVAALSMDKKFIRSRQKQVRYVTRPSFCIDHPQIRGLLL